MEANGSFSAFRAEPAGLRSLTTLTERPRVYAPDSCGRMRMSPDGRFAMLNNGILWNLEEDRVVFEKEYFWMTGGFTADSQLCLLGRQDLHGALREDEILLLCTETGETVSTFREKARCLVLEGEGRFFLMAREEPGALRFSRIRTEDGICTAQWSYAWTEPELIPMNLYLAENGKALYVELGSLQYRRGSGPSRLLKFRPDTGEALFQGEVKALVCPQSCTEKTIVTENGQVLDAADGRELRRFGDGTSMPVALLPDGITVACGAEDRACEGSALVCYNSRSGEKIAKEIVWMDPLSPFPVDVFPREIAAGPDGKRLLYVFQVNGRTKAFLCEADWSD